MHSQRGTAGCASSHTGSIPEHPDPSLASAQVACTHARCCHVSHCAAPVAPSRCLVRQVQQDSFLSPTHSTRSPSLPSCSYLLPQHPTRAPATCRPLASLSFAPALPSASPPAGRGCCSASRSSSSSSAAEQQQPRFLLVLALVVSVPVGRGKTGSRAFQGQPWQRSPKRWSSSRLGLPLRA